MLECNSTSPPWARSVERLLHGAPPRSGCSKIYQDVGMDTRLRDLWQHVSFLWVD